MSTVTSSTAPAAIKALRALLKVSRRWFGLHCVSASEEIKWDDDDA
jgi:hypothetical protein